MRSTYWFSRPPPSTTLPSLRRAQMIRRLCDPIETAHVLAEGGGNLDRPVGLLVVLEDRCHGSGKCQPGAVQGVHELGLAGLVAVSDICPARLELSEVRAGGDLQVTVLAWDVRLEVEFFPLGEAHVPGAHQQHPVWNFEPPEDVFCIGYQRFQGGHRLFRLHELDHLDLVELMETNVATGIFAGRARLAAEV